MNETTEHIEDAPVEREAYIFPPLTVIMFLVLAILTGLITGIGLIYALGAAFGFSIQETMSQMSDPSSASFVRLMVAINHLTMFVLPALAIAALLFRKQMWQVLGLDRHPRVTKFFLTALFMVFLMPIAQFVYQVNKSLPLPEWAHMMEGSINEKLLAMLKVTDFWGLVSNVIVIALIPAIGEELVFRGFIQGQLARKINPIAAIWVSAFVFSAFHMQFEGFLARLLLGAALGYLLYWTDSLWTAIWAHFFNNALQVIVAGVMSDKINIIDLEAETEIPWYVVLSCLCAATAIGILISKKERAIFPNSNEYHL